MKKVLVLGIGNRLMMDDGIGVHVVEELSKRNSDPDVCYIAGETDVGFCQQQIGEASSVIIVDAAYLGKEYGTTSTIPLQQVLQCSPYTISFHEFDLFKELKTEGKSIEGMLIGIEPYEINYGMQLSGVLQNKFQDIVDKVESIIASYVFDNIKNPNRGPFYPPLHRIILHNQLLINDLSIENYKINMAVIKFDTLLSNLRLTRLIPKLYESDAIKIWYNDLECFNCYDRRTTILQKVTCSQLQSGLKYKIWRTARR